VRGLLAAREEQFAAAVDDIDRRLRAEIRAIQRHRERIAQLAAGDNLALPPEAVAYLNRLRALGFSERLIGGERDAWILVAAQLPQHMPRLMALKEWQLDDPALKDLYRELGATIDWDPRTRACRGSPTTSWRCWSRVTRQSRRPERSSRSPPTSSSCSTRCFSSSVPMAPRLLELLEQRGWTGWTKLERVERARW
jgi:hypothetical protein